MSLSAGSPTSSPSSTTRVTGASSRGLRRKVHGAAGALYRDLIAYAPGHRAAHDDTVALFLRALAAAVAAERIGGRDASWDALQDAFETSPPCAGLLPLRGPGSEWREAIGEGTVERLEEAVALLVSCSMRPYGAISGAYQDLLDIPPAGDGRRRKGIFYTPEAIARMTARAALASLPRAGTLPRVVDPAMGTGIFLLEAARILHDRFGWPLHEVAEGSLFGADADGVAADLAVLILWLETGASTEVLRRHLQHGDGLDGTLISDSRFDAVIGNPPWGAEVTPEQRARYTAAPGGVQDSFKLFLDRATTLTCGTVGVVVPQAVMAQSRHADVRSLLLERLAPYGCITLGDGIFARAAAPACVLLFGPPPGPAYIAVWDIRSAAARGSVDGACGAPVSSIPATRWTSESFATGDADLLDLLGRLQARHPHLGTLYRIRDTGINYNRAAVARRSLYVADLPEDLRDLPRYRGRDFNRYTQVRRGGWLRHDVEATLAPGETFSLGRETCRLPQKVVVRQTADRLIATIDSTRMAMGRSVIAITGEGGPSLHALLACLNSRLLTALYRAMAGEEGRILPQVKVARLERLPIPAASTLPAPRDGAPSIASFMNEDRRHLIARAATDQAFGWLCLDTLARGLLDRDGNEPSLESAVDEIVSHLYGLTPAELEIVGTKCPDRVPQ